MCRLPRHGSRSRCTVEVGGGNEIDVALYADVLRRHRAVVLVGVTLTVALAVLSYVRVSPSGISYRSSEIWSNQATLVLTQEGAPELRSVLPTSAAGGYTSLADTGRFAGLIDVYATLATSDPVLRQLRRRGLVAEKDLENGANPITAAAVVSTVNGAPTPMMTITATALSGPKATELTKGATKAFLSVVRSRQLAAKIPVKDRIQLRVVKSSGEPTVLEPRSKALLILVLLGGLIATAAVAFTRDNVGRREGVPVPITTASRNEPAEPDSSTGVTHGRSALESVPRPDSATASGRDVPDEVAERASQAGNPRWGLRQARTWGNPQR
jgi:hypothetical protein